MEAGSFAQKAYEAIKEDIVSQKLKPGSFISEAEYAEKIGVSRTPVREALKTLEREGLLNIYPRKGVQIRNFTLEDIVQIHEAAEAMESVLIAAVAERSAQGRLDSAALAELRGLLDRMDACLEEGRMQDWVTLDQRFHNRILQLCDNPYIVEYASASRSRMNLTLWFITPKYADKRQSSQDHRAILAAIKKGDPVAAREASSSHIFRVRKNFMEAMGL